MCKYCGIENNENLEEIGSDWKSAGELQFDLDVFVSRNGDKMELVVSETIADIEVNYLRIEMPYCPFCGRKM